MLIFGCGCSSPFISYQLVVNIMNIIFVKRGQACFENSGLHYTEDLLSKKERKKKKKKTFNGRELHMYRPSMACTLTLNCIRGGFHGTQHLVFRLSHFNAAIFRADNFCNCLNSSCASFGEKKIEVPRIVFALISINWHFGGVWKKLICP